MEDRLGLVRKTGTKFPGVFITFAFTETNTGTVVGGFGAILGTTAPGPTPTPTPKCNS